MKRIPWARKSWWSGLMWGGLLAFLWLPMSASAQSSAQSNTKEEKTESWAVRVTKMTTKQKLAKVSQVVKEARRIHNNMIEKLKAAREQKDLLAVDCLGEKFSRAQALMFLMENKRSEFLKKLAQNKTAEADAEFVNLMQSYGSLKNIEVEASQCRGKAGTYTGNTRVDFEVPPRIADGDPTLPPWKEPVVYRPTNASNPY